MSNNSGFEPLSEIVTYDCYVVSLGPTCRWFNGIEIVEAPFFKGCLV